MDFFGRTPGITAGIADINFPNIANRRFSHNSYCISITTRTFHKNLPPLYLKLSLIFLCSHKVSENSFPFRGSRRRFQQFNRTRIRFRSDRSSCIDDQLVMHTCRYRRRIKRHTCTIRDDRNILTGFDAVVSAHITCSRLNGSTNSSTTIMTLE